MLKEDNFEAEEEYRKIKCDNMGAGLRKDKRSSKTSRAEGELEGFKKCKKHRAIFSEHLRNS
jgi:hypothetical protein